MRGSGRLSVALTRALDDPDRSSVGILTYHRVARRVAGLSAPLHNVPPDRFRRQLTGLLERGFRVVSLDALLAARREGTPLPERSVVLTFDDGFGSVYHEAWPVLRELRLPATLFLTTAFLDAEAPFPFDAWGVRHEGRAPAEASWPLRAEQCREMAASGLVQLACHTHTHADFRGRPDELARDLERSLEVLALRFALGPVPFAFPFGTPADGYADPELVAAVRAAGLTCALTTEPVAVDLQGDPYRWGRFNVFAWDTAATLEAKLRGFYTWAPRAFRRVRGGSRPAPARPAALHPEGGVSPGGPR